MKTAKKRIGIVGIGGVGGYYGGKIARICNEASTFEIIFIMRNEGKEFVKKNGLHVSTKTESFTVHPTLVSDSTEEIGMLDLLLFSTKSYDLADSAAEYRACVDQRTIVLPLLNGIENTATLQTIYHDAVVLQGCSYIVSRMESPGTIVESGNFNELIFGDKSCAEETYAWFTAILRDARINYSYRSDIEVLIWRKFLFVCTIGTLTSYLNMSIGSILETPNHKEDLIALMKELIALAKRKGINLGEDIIPQTLDKMYGLPYNTTSSLQHDFAKGKATEIESLTGYVYKEGILTAVYTPRYEHIYHQLISHNNLKT